MQRPVWVIPLLILISFAVPQWATAQRSGKIAFVSERDGNEEIYVVNPDGTGMTRLTNRPGSDNEPTFSPEGTKIAFVSAGREVQVVAPNFRVNIIRIYLMNADGTGVTPVGPAGGSAPTFSPDGRKIAFLNSPGGRGFSVFVMNVDGSNVTRLTRDYRVDPLTPPSFSPDGRKIAFTCLGVCVMNADGTEVRKLTLPSTISIQIFYSVFSSDGRQIAFAGFSSQGGASDIYVLYVDSGDVTRLTDHPASDSAPAFSPDGSKIAFVSHRDGNAEIYVMNADGTDARRLTNHPAADYSPAWR